MAKPIQSFEAFWPYYLREHSKPSTRAIHVIGTVLAMTTLATALFTGNLYALLLVPVVGYGAAWVSHFFIEKNRPATFTYPLWSLLADFKLCAMTLTFQIGPELMRAGVGGRTEQASSHP
ncbi:MAG: DUF962 domain-containing protein [Myxococcota bacterium]